MKELRLWLVMLLMMIVMVYVTKYFAINLIKEKVKYVVVDKTNELEWNYYKDKVSIIESSIYLLSRNHPEIRGACYALAYRDSIYAEELYKRLNSEK
jgi:hypothetical protein